MLEAPPASLQSLQQKLYLSLITNIPTSMDHKQQQNTHTRRTESTQSPAGTAHEEPDPQPGQSAVLLTISGVGRVLLTLDQLSELLHKTIKDVQQLLSSESSSVDIALQSSQEFRTLVENGTFPRF